MALKGNPFEKEKMRPPLPVTGPRIKPKFEKIALGAVPSPTEALSKTLNVQHGEVVSPSDVTSLSANLTPSDEPTLYKGSDEEDSETATSSDVTTPSDDIALTLNQTTPTTDSTSHSDAIALSANLTPSDEPALFRGSDEENSKTATPSDVTTPSDDIALTLNQTTPTTDSTSHSDATTLSANLTPSDEPTLGRGSDEEGSENTSPSNPSSPQEVRQTTILTDCRAFNPKQQKASVGYAGINHKASEYLYSTALDANEYRLIIFLIRETWGWKTTWLDVSGAMAAKKIGWDTSQFWRTMKGLRMKGLILSEQLDGSQSNYYRLNPHFFGEKPKIKNSDTSTPSDGTTLGENPSSLSSVMSALGTQCGHNTTNMDSSDGFSYSNSALKNSLKKDLKNSLSLFQFLKSSQLAELEARWMSFMKKEREREEKGLLKLFRQKPEEAETIFKAFKIVLKEQEEYGEIKSAISVLETNYTAQYKTKALAAIERENKRLAVQNEIHSDKDTHQREEEIAAQRHLIHMRCFEETFSDLQVRKKYIFETCRKSESSFVFAQRDPFSPIAVGYAVSHWAQGEGSEKVLAALDAFTSGKEELHESQISNNEMA